RARSESGRVPRLARGRQRRMDGDVAGAAAGGERRRPRRPRRSVAPCAGAWRLRADRTRPGRRGEVRRLLAIAVAAALVLGQSRPALAYLKFGVPVRGQQVTVKWAQ